MKISTMGSNQECSLCVLDTSDPDIRFDESGVCSFCRQAEQVMAILPQTRADEEKLLSRVASRIRHAGQGREYDCLLGVSGGVDSSYVAYLAKQLDLRPLVVHFDNGWNSELAVENINRLVDRLGFDLYTYVIDWEEFRDLQRAFLKASVVDIEMLTDHAIQAAVFSIARKNRIRYVLSGSNIATEFGMPAAWIWDKQDLRNIREIQKRFGEGSIRSFPTLNTWTWLVMYYLKIPFEYISLLNCVRYRKKEAIELLEREIGWRYYGGKHYESVFTKFYQAYILPEKFGIDKRRVHFSSLIRNGEMRREEALAQLARPLYESIDLANEKEYVLKKLGFTDEEFDKIMHHPPMPHNAYPSNERIRLVLKSIYRLVQNLWRR